MACTAMQVEGLFKELCEAIPSGFMMQDFSDAAEASPDKGAQSVAELSPEDLEVSHMLHQT